MVSFYVKVLDSKTGLEDWSAVGFLYRANAEEWIEEQSREGRYDLFGKDCHGIRYLLSQTVK